MHKYNCLQTLGSVAYWYSLGLAYHRLAAQVSWPGLRVGSCLALTYIRQMNRVNSQNDLCIDDSTINIVPGITIIIIIITLTYPFTALPPMVRSIWPAKILLLTSLNAPFDRQ